MPVLKQGTETYYSSLFKMLIKQLKCTQHQHYNFNGLLILSFPRKFFFEHFALNIKERDNTIIIIKNSMGSNN